MLNLQALSSYFMFVSFLPYGTLTVVCRAFLWQSLGRFSMEARDSFCFPKNTKNPNPSPIGKKFGFSLFGADKRTWTSTELPRLEPESNASANSAISAYSVVFLRRGAGNDNYYTRCSKIVKHFFEKLFIFLEIIILSHFLQSCSSAVSCAGIFAVFPTAFRHS